MWQNVDLRKNGATRCCADDVGAVTFGASGRRALGRNVRLAESFATLVLKPKQCAAMPLAVKLSSEAIRSTQALLGA
eukprot:6340813-Pyramimonas_sp.AAC.1